MEKSILEAVLIASVTPYFLERSCLWFEENIKQILEARKTQSFFQDNTVYAEKNSGIKLSEFLRKLDEMGYEKVQTISEPGEFSRQGGVVDVFPLNMNYAVRMEFFGNSIESIEKLPIAIAHEKEVRERIKKKLSRQKIFSQLGNLKLGDYLVHLDHGVARFAGIEGSPTSLNIEGSRTSFNYYVLE